MGESRRRDGAASSGGGWRVGQGVYDAAWIRPGSVAQPRVRRERCLFTPSHVALAANRAATAPSINRATTTSSNLGRDRPGREWIVGTFAHSYNRRMETYDAIRARRKINAYDDKPIEEEQLSQILEAGRRSPSSRNSQRWDFIVVRDKERLATLAKCWRGAAHIADAPVAIGVVAPISDDPRENASINFDLGQAVTSMMIAAADLGIGSRHASVQDYDLAAEALALPEGRRLTWLFGLGYPGDRPLKPVINPERRPFEDVVHYETW